MPKFIYTIVISAIILWGIIIKLLFSTKPDSSKNILIFLAMFFIALTLTLSIPIYFYLLNNAPTFSSLRLIYRKSLKWSLYFSFGIVSLMGLRAFSVLTVLNFSLFLILYFAIMTQIKSRR